MTWLCPFIRSRKTKSNFIDNEENVDDDNFNDENVNRGRDEAVDRNDRSSEEEDENDDDKKVYSVRNIWLHPLNLIFSDNNKREKKMICQKNLQAKRKRKKIIQMNKVKTN